MNKKLFYIIIYFFIAFLFLNINVFAFGPSSNKLYNGIDVSEWQGNINFIDVSNSGVEIVFIKASEGLNYIDPYFKDNYTNAKNSGLKVGFYHFLTAKNIEDARKEAEFFVSTIKGTRPDCKLAMDFEVFNNLSLKQINEISLEFLKTVQNLSGKECIIYSDAYNARNVFDKNLANTYPIWVADYYVEEPEDNGKWLSWVGFQYTDKGRVDGIIGNVDKDYFTNSILLTDTSNIPESTEDSSTPKFENIIVRRGNTLSELAIKYNTSYMYLAKINNIKNPNLIYAGQNIKVPILENNEISDTSHRLYIVRAGNTLTEISNEFNVSIKNIVELNNIKNPNLIFTGEILRIPVINSINFSLLSITSTPLKK